MHEVGALPCSLAAQERAVMSQAETAQFVRELREAMNQLDALPMPTVGELAAAWRMHCCCLDGRVEPSRLRCGRPCIAQP